MITYGFGGKDPYWWISLWETFQALKIFSSSITKCFQRSKLAFLFFSTTKKTRPLENASHKENPWCLLKDTAIDMENISMKRKVFLPWEATSNAS